MRTCVDCCSNRGNLAAKMFWGPPMPKVSVLLSETEDARFSAYCDERGYKKSTLIARLVREHLDREGYAAQASLSFGSDTSDKSGNHRHGESRQ